MSTTNDRAPRKSQVSARLDPETVELVERVASAERRRVSSVVRNIVEDWAAERREQVA